MATADRGSMLELLVGRSHHCDIGDPQELATLIRIRLKSRLACLTPWSRLRAVDESGFALSNALNSLSAS
jgi:hypothetical protein